jgi:epoxide hydrolase-like predicted phosphatase
VPDSAAHVDQRLTGLLVDWGGVLTGPIRTAVTSWAESDGFDMEIWSAIMRDWLGGPVGEEALLNPIHALERGEIEVPEFDSGLAAELSRRTGRHYAPEGLVDRMFSHFQHAPDMSALVRRARAAGVRTGLLSNSWGTSYPRDGWEEMFDVVVISGEVGMRKPEPRIFTYAAEMLGLPAQECVLVDDISHNVKAAVGVGMVGVHHVAYDQTLLELEALFALDLS